MTDEPKRVEALVFGDADGDSISVNLHLDNMLALTDALGGIEAQLEKNSGSERPETYDYSGELDRLAHYTGEISKALVNTLQSPNEMDRNGECANVVDGLFAIARALNRVADAVYDAKSE